MFFRNPLIQALVPTYAAVFSMYVSTCSLVAYAKSRTVSSLPELKCNVLSRLVIIIVPIYISILILQYP
jgi:hypothetical protein